MTASASPEDAQSATRGRDTGQEFWVVEPDALRSAVPRLAEGIAANAPLSVAAAKRTAHLSGDASMTGAWAEAERIWDPLCRSADAQDGPEAFRDRHSAVWTGR